MSWTGIVLDCAWFCKAYIFHVGNFPKPTSYTVAQHMVPCLFLRTNTEDTLEFHIFSMHIKVKMNPKVTLGQQTSRAYAFPAIATALEQKRFFFNSPVQKSYHKKWKLSPIIWLTLLPPPLSGKEKMKRDFRKDTNTELVVFPSELRLHI